ncbi:phosphoribosylaminoimidazolesuccinocarboxamide synthase [Candidatus Saccharibacteria bacterium RIFCSPHIGHO2_12_FULL_47_16b]|nr:MAG: phosphoribosylaminoimidazolesuccinocarboxamide synthase [Candidatus Saccharibacteria bacterium RIFCSPHIGHO2_12_FULL_47_16b]
MTGAITSTDFAFPGQTGVYHGKVRDVYSIKDKYLVAVATDRISAFDVILPHGIPYKGQVLNQLSDYFLTATADVAPNWLLSTPDPNVSIGKKCQPFKVEMVIRGCLVGHAWREYQAGKRQLCGSPMPDGLKEYDEFPEPILTPATKADAGHDEDISLEEIISRGLATKQEWTKLEQLTRNLFAKGQAMAAKRNLYLADTKYEFGKLGDEILLIDEVHTPDSSRYFYLDSYRTYLKDRKEVPNHLSKEFVREWLMERGFMGQKGQKMPDMNDEFVNSVSARYIELYEEMTGQKFVKPGDEDPLKRIEKNVIVALEQI